MPKRSNLTNRRPVGATRKQRQAWIDDALRRRHVVTAAVVDAATLAAAAAPVDERPVEPVARPGWRRRMWDRRPLFAALVLDAALLWVIIPTQIGYYRLVGGLNPEIGPLVLRTYLMVPIVTESLSAFFGLMAGFVIDHGTGRYKLYLRLMWFFAAVAALVNVKNGWLHVDDGTHVTAFLLGGLSLCVPLVWHSYTGMRVAVKVGLTIAELSRIYRGWFRHPLFSFRTARAVDLFPTMTRQEVWDMIVMNHRDKLVQKWTTKPEQRRELRRQERDGLNAGLLALAGVRHVADIVFRFRWKTRPARPEPGMNRKVNQVDEGVPGSTSAVQVSERPGAPAETPAETTGELRAASFLIYVWHEFCGEHLGERRLSSPPRGTGARLAREHNVSASYVSKVFGQCARGELQNPFTNSDKGNVNQAGE
jgi:hypothetical protein